LRTLPCVLRMGPHFFYCTLWISRKGWMRGTLTQRQSDLKSRIILWITLLSSDLSILSSTNRWLVKWKDLTSWNKVICKSQVIRKARIASFGIIGHQTHNCWKWKWFLQNEITGTQTSFSTNFGCKQLSFIPSLPFFLSASTAATTYIYIYIFSLLLHVGLRQITLEPCALNAEFQHFILRFNKISLLCRYHWKRG